jgi:hypothetical protein
MPLIGQFTRISANLQKGNVQKGNERETSDTVGGGIGPRENLTLGALRSASSTK